MEGKYGREWVILRVFVHKNRKWTGTVMGTTNGCDCTDFWFVCGHSTASLFGPKRTIFFEIYHLSPLLSIVQLARHWEKMWDLWLTGGRWPTDQFIYPSEETKYSGCPVYHFTHMLVSIVLYASCFVCDQVDWMLKINELGGQSRSFAFVFSV